MSMILDAMKRSKDGETRTSDIPTVDTVHYVPKPEPRFSRWQVGAMLAGVVGLIAVVLTAMWPSEPESHAAAPSGHHSVTSPIVPSPDTVMPTASVPQRTDQLDQRPAVQQPKIDASLTAAAPPSDAGQRSSVESPARQTPTLKTNQDLRPASAPTSVQRGRSGPVKSVFASVRMTTQAAKPATGSDELRAIYQALNEEASQTAVTDESGALSDGGESGSDDSVSPSFQESDEAPPVDFADILAAAQEELGVKPLVESSEPLLETLSQQIKDDIPSLIYSEHRYDPTGRSSVTLNGKTVKERQRVGAFTVIEILPDSVVLRWRETQFRVRARNSWVNM